AGPPPAAVPGARPAIAAWPVAALRLSVPAVSSDVQLTLQLSAKSQDGIAQRRVQLGHVEWQHVAVGVFVLKVHAVEAHHEAERDEDGANDSQHLHYLIHAVALVGEEEVGQRRNVVAVAFGQVQGLNGVVVGIAVIGF
nr:hypothetical protein [Tanacetum cinerariifolium]